MDEVEFDVDVVFAEAGETRAGRDKYHAEPRATPSTAIMMMNGSIRFMF